jgi:hypothetical protein
MKEHVEFANVLVAYLFVDSYKELDMLGYVYFEKDMLLKVELQDFVYCKYKYLMKVVYRVGYNC